MDYVEKHNSESHSFTVGLNEFADMTSDEFVDIFNGVGVEFDEAPVVEMIPDPENVEGYTVNWVAAGAVTGIKNQGQCGSCWSFSATGSMEGAHFLSTKNLVSFSEQNLMDCSWSYGDNGCDGGLMDYAFQYVIANKGLDSEASYPYTAQSSQTCLYNAANSVGFITGYKDIPSGSEAALTSAINSQPISVAIDASHISFQLYTSGVYYEPACSSTQLGHGVLAVGYGTDTDTGKAFYFVKNSWGTSWGMNGYIWMSRNANNNCGIATMSSYPTGAQ